MVYYDNISINTVFHDIFPKILGLPPMVPELPFPSRYINTAVTQSRWGVKMLWLVIKQVFVCTAVLLLYQRTVMRVCSGDPPHVDSSTWLTFQILRTDGKVSAWSRSFLRISDVRAQRRRQLLRLLPFEVRRKVKNNMLQFQIFSD